MADIFEIVGKFAIDGADKAKKDINDIADAGEKSSSKLGKFGKVLGGVGKGVLAVAGAVSAGGVALVKSVQSSYGELQQNLGGSEAVYGQYASNIQEIAKDAYKNMGMSQSEYLATANKMGSLFQGSGIAQKEALDMTTKAMQRASDVASVMGIDMSVAMESIAGAAKGNFTMMDNLGVAMNATTLESYALSKGMTDFSWKSASSAEKNALAMQMFLERTEQYAGNFARESTDTISGAIGYLGASWQNFIAGLGNPTADMAQLTNQLAQSFGAMINNIVPIVENIANALPTVLPSIVNAISGLAPSLIQTFTDVITKMINSIIPLLPTVIPLFVDMLVQVGMALAQNAPILIDGFVQLITQLTVAISQNLPTLIPIFIDCMVQIAGAIIQNAPIILDAILSIGGNFESGLSPAINACIGLVQVLTGAFIAFKAGAMIQSVVQGFQSAKLALSLFKLETQGASVAQGLLNGQLTIGETIVGLLTGQVKLSQIATGLWSKAQGVLNAVMSANPIALVVIAIGALIAIIVVAYNKCDWFRNAVNAVFNSLKTEFTAVVNFFKTLPSKVKSVGGDLVKGIWNGISNGYKWITGKIKEWCGNVVDKIKGFFGIHSPSRVMRDEIGKPIVDGVAVGIKENSGEVSKEFQKMLDDLQLQRDLGIIDEAEYYSKLEVLRDNHLEKGTKDWWKYTQEIINYETKAYEDINASYEQHLEDRKNLTDGFYGKISSKSLYNTFKFDYGDRTETWTALNVWDDELKFLDEFENKIITVQDRLKTVFADDEILKSILDTIRSDPFGEGANVLDAMFTADDKQLTVFAEGYKKYIDKAKSITNNVYSDDLAKLDVNFIQKISEKFKNSPLPEQLKDLGANLTENLMSGIDSKGGWLKDQIISFCNSISQTFSDGLNIGFSDNFQLTEANGVRAISNRQTNYTVQLNNINDAIDNLISLVGEYLQDISQKMNRPLVVDGNSLAVGMSRNIDTQLGKLSVAKDRGNV